MKQVAPDIGTPLHPESACTKHPNHTGFIKVSDFTVEHLPKACQDPSIFQSIQTTAQLTCRVLVHTTSKHRPKQCPFTGEPYPFSESQGIISDSVTRAGSGFVSRVSFSSGDTTSDGTPQHVQGSFDKRYNTRVLCRGDLTFGNVQRQGTGMHEKCQHVQGSFDQTCQRVLCQGRETCDRVKCQGGETYESVQSQGHDQCQRVQGTFNKRCERVQSCQGDETGHHVQDCEGKRECREAGDDPCLRPWATVLITTARHVIFDQAEAQSAEVELFYDSEESRTRTLRVLKCHRFMGAFDDVSLDVCWVSCVTQDLALARHLQDLLQTGRRLQTGLTQRTLKDTLSRIRKARHHRRSIKESPALLDSEASLSKLDKQTGPGQHNRSQGSAVADYILKREWLNAEKVPMCDANYYTERAYYPCNRYDAGMVSFGKRALASEGDEGTAVKNMRSQSCGDSTLDRVAESGHSCVTYLDHSQKSLSDSRVNCLDVLQLQRNSIEPRLRSFDPTYYQQTLLRQPNLRYFGKFCSTLFSTLASENYDNTSDSRLTQVDLFKKTAFGAFVRQTVSSRRTLPPRKPTRPQSQCHDDTVQETGTFGLSPAPSVSRLAVVVSHPHGVSKRISIGQWVHRQREPSLRGATPFARYTYDTPTCPGSSGGPMWHAHSLADLWPVHSRSLDGRLNLNHSSVGVDSRASWLDLGTLWAA